MSEALPQFPDYLAAVESAEVEGSRGARRRLLPRAILVGVLSGALAAAFRIAVTQVESLARGVLGAVDENRLWAIGLVALIAALGASLGLLIGKLDPRSGGSGIPHAKAVLEGHATFNWKTLIPAKFFGAVCSLGSGLALGREGPTVQMGGAVGAAVGDWTRSNLKEQRALAAAGAGSGLAAAFNAPLAGVTFVLEELQRDFHPVVLSAAVLSAVLATALARLIGGPQPAFQVPVIAPPSILSLPAFALLGVLGGLVGPLFNRALICFSDAGLKLRQKATYAIPLLAGTAACLAFWASPLLLGGGHSLSEAGFDGRFAIGEAAGLFLIRFIFIQVSYATGAPGGIFAPLLSLGSLLGAFVFAAMSAAHLPAPQAATLAVAGMCAVFTGVVRAPLTAVILIAEMTGGYELLLPLLASSYAAYAVAEGLKDMPIYEALLVREARLSGVSLGANELLTREIEIAEGAPFDGRAVRDLNLPEGVLITLVRSQGRDQLPGPGTILRSHDRITVRVASEAGLEAARRGASRLQGWDSND